MPAAFAGAAGILFLFVIVPHCRVMHAQSDRGVGNGKAADEVGRLAQLAERLVYTEKVGGSNPSSPTIKTRA